MRRRAALALAVALLVALGACGVPVDSEPRSLGVDGVISPEATSTTSPVPAGRRTTLYFTADEVLVRVQRAVNEDLNVRQTLELLLEGPIRSEESRGISSPIPEDTALLGADLSNGRLTVDLSKSILQIQGPGARLAYAQLVYTAVANPGVDRVRFLVEGDAIEVPTDEGSLAVVTRDDFRSVAPGTS